MGLSRDLSASAARCLLFASALPSAASVPQPLLSAAPVLGSGWSVLLSVSSLSPASATQWADLTDCPTCADWSKLPTGENFVGPALMFTDGGTDSTSLADTNTLADCIAFCTGWVDPDNNKPVLFAQFFPDFPQCSCMSECKGIPHTNPAPKGFGTITSYMFCHPAPSPRHPPKYLPCTIPVKNCHVPSPSHSTCTPAFGGYFRFCCVIPGWTKPVIVKKRLVRCIKG